VGFACCWLVSGARPSASAQASSELSYSLSWVRDPGAESCIASARLALALEELVGPILRSASEAERSIEGIVRFDAQTKRWQVRIRLLDRAGRELGLRELEREAASCAELDRSILLVAALAVAPADGNAALPAALARLTLEEEPGPMLLSELEQTSPGVAQPNQAPKASMANVEPSPLTKAREPQQPALIGELSMAAAAAWGLLPTPRPGARVAARLRLPRRLSSAVALQYWSRSEVATYDGGQAAFRAADAVLSGCGSALQQKHWQLDLCIGGIVGARLVRAEGSSQSRNPTQPYWGPNLTSEISYRFASRWLLLVSAAGSALWPRDRFTYGDSSGRTSTIFHPSRLTGSLALGLGVRI